jgi:hypothetical protein
MSYFEDVYLKRLNKEGLTQQERVKSRKEKEFNMLFLKKTEYQANIYQINEEESNLICSLQPNKWNETQLISNLLISTSAAPLKTGDILRIFQKIKDVEYDKVWLVLFCEENVTKGYLSYKIICLDSEINITNEYGDTLYSIPVKFVNSSSSLVKDYFFYRDTSYREPQREIRCITKDFDFLKKDIYFEYKEKGFEISGIDNISIDNIAYVSLSERLISEVEPRSSANIPIDSDTNFFLNNR